MTDGVIWQALGQVLSWPSVLASLVGVLLGLVVGALPGFTISLGMVLVLPLTFGLESIHAMSLMLGLFAAGMTGGSYSAILIKIPGTPSASATVIDGHRMALHGVSRCNSGPPSSSRCSRWASPSSPPSPDTRSSRA